MNERTKAEIKRLETAAVPKWVKDLVKDLDREATRLGRQVEELRSLFAKGVSGEAAAFSLGSPYDGDAIRLPKSVLSDVVTWRGPKGQLLSFRDRHDGVIEVMNHEGPVAIVPQVTNVFTIRGVGRA